MIQSNFEYLKTHPTARDAEIRLQWLENTCEQLRKYHNPKKQSIIRSLLIRYESLIDSLNYSLEKGV